MNKKDRQCKAWRDRLTPHQYEDPISKILTNRAELREMENSRDKNGSEQRRQMIKHWLYLLIPAIPTP